MRMKKEYQLVTSCLIIFFMIFSPVYAANIPLTHSNFEIWNGQLSDKIYDIAISDNGHYIVAGSRDGTVSLIDQAGNLLWAYNNMKVNGLLANPDYGGDKWASVAISSDGEYIAAGIWDNSGDRTRSPKILFFDRSGNLLWTAPAQNVADVAITPDGNNVAVVADNGAIVFTNEGAVVWEYDDLYFGDSISISDDGAIVAWTGDFNSVSMFDSGGSLMWEQQTGNGRGWGSDHLYGEMSADGSVLLVVQHGPPDPVAGLFGKDSSLLWSHTEPNNSCNSGKISANGEYSVIGMENKVSLFNRLGNVIWTENFDADSSPTGNIYSNNYLVDISQDGSFISAASPGYGMKRDTLTIMTKSGEILWAAKVRTDQLVMSADGEYIATASGNTMYLFKKDRNSDNPPYTTDLKSDIKYDAKSYIGDYIFSKYLTTANLVIEAIIIGVLIGIGYGIWRIKKHFCKKNP